MKIELMSFLKKINNSNKAYARAIIIIAIVFLLTGCANHYAPDAMYDPYGFFSGIWHGFVFPLSLAANIISWILSLLDIHVFENIEIIGRPNTGIFYYLGFAIGISSGSGGASTVVR